MRFAAARGELMGSLPAEGPGAGAMAAVFASAARVAAALEEANGEAEVPGLGVAADNGTHQVVSGPLEQVEALAAELGGGGGAGGAAEHEPRVPQRADGAGAGGP